MDAPPLSRRLSSKRERLTATAITIIGCLSLSIVYIYRASESAATVSLPISTRLAQRSTHKVPPTLGPCSTRKMTLAGLRANAKAGISLIPKNYSAIVPTGDFVLAKFEEEEDFAEGGIWLPESLKSKPNLATIVDVGSGRTDDGSSIDFEVKKGDVVLYTRFGTTGIRELELEKTGENVALIKYSDLAGRLPNADDYELDDFEPLQNFILVKADEVEESTTGGVFLGDADQEKPACGVVVKAGPGEIKDGERLKMTIKEGDIVLYSKYAGDELEDEDEKVYVVLREGDVLCKLTP